MLYSHYSWPNFPKHHLVFEYKNRTCMDALLSLRLKKSCRYMSDQSSKYISKCAIDNLNDSRKLHICVDENDGQTGVIWSPSWGNPNKQVQFIDASHQNWKSRYFSWNEQYVICGWIYHFSYSLTLAVLQRQKAYRILAVLPCRPPSCHGAWRPHHDRWDYTSNFVQYISAFKWILLMRSSKNISHYTTAKLSVHVWNHDLIWWQNKNDKQKYFHETKITSF